MALAPILGLLGKLGAGSATAGVPGAGAISSGLSAVSAASAPTFLQRLASGVKDVNALGIPGAGAKALGGSDDLVSLLSLLNTTGTQGPLVGMGAGGTTQREIEQLHQRLAQRRGQIPTPLSPPRAAPSGGGSTESLQGLLALLSGGR